MTKSNANKNFVFLLRNLRYVFVFSLLVLIFFFGGDYQPAKNKVQIKEFDLATNKIYRLGPGKENIEIDNILSTNKNKYYRLSFDTKVLPDLTKLQPDSATLSSKPQQNDININLRGIFGTEKQIGQASINATNQIEPQEVVFAAEDNFRDIIFQRNNTTDKSQIDFFNLEISPIDCATSSCVTNLMPTINGESQKVIKSFASGETLRSSSFVFSRKNELIGRVIDVNFDHIQSIDMAMIKVGTGGLGNYQIRLFKVKQNEDNLGIDTQPVATVYFSPDDLGDYQIGENRYRFPLTAKLSRGEKYFIGVSNTEIKFNYLNNLRIVESGGRYAKDKGVIDKSIRLVDENIYLAINTVQNFSGSSERFLINARIEDLGAGQGVYSYHFSRSPADFLDTDSITFENALGFAYRDNVSGGVSMSSLGRNQIIYKFDTVYPFARFFVKVTQPIEFTSGLLYYSYDNLNWVPILSNKDVESDFNVILSGDGKAHIIYLKMTTNPHDVTKPIKLFNIHSIDILASLKLK